MSETSENSSTDETQTYQPKFDADGLMPAMVIEAGSGTPLMMAFVNQDAIDQTLATGYATFWSRSRQKYWQKGETSGNRLKLTDLLIDCDQDSLVMLVTMEGDEAACHTGRRSCYYRSLAAGEATMAGEAPLTLTFNDNKRLFDPNSVYKK
ncbi:MAG: phosphoribosyl-AMP cyclohydrolase [Rhodomicrobium sp.]|nr:MAG: phosphoribosyl-AMP cyclohydrolase [Rhodomicrobium sp.]